MPTIRKPEDPKQPQGAPAKRPDAAERIRHGKAELRDDELTKVVGGQRSHKQFTLIE